MAHVSSVSFSHGKNSQVSWITDLLFFYCKISLSLCRSINWIAWVFLMTGLHVATRRENIKILLMTWHSFEFGLVLILGGWWVCPVMSVKRGNNFNNVSYPSFPCCFLFLPQHTLSIYIVGVFYGLSLFVYFRGCSSVRKLAALFYETKLLQKRLF